MYTNKPRTLGKLKQAITQEIVNLIPEQFSKAIWQFWCETGCAIFMAVLVYFETKEATFVEKQLI